MAIRDTYSTPGISLNEGPFLIIALGNVGKEYELTRHNAGFMALSHFAHRYDLGAFKDKPDLNASIIETTIDGDKVILAKPTTFMNKSGLAIVKLQNYFAVNDPRILVIYDDVDLDFGTIRTRLSGNSGGHNGIKSIQQVIGSDFARIRIGVKNEHLEHQDTADFVLSNFSRAEMQNLMAIFDKTTEFIDSFIQRSFVETSHSI